MATVSEMPEDEPVEKVAQVAAKKLQNSAILSVLLSGVQESSANQSEQIIKLVHEFPSLFSDVPGRTTMLTHDIDVGESHPVKQHTYGSPPHSR